MGLRFRVYFDAARVDHVFDTRDCDGRLGNLRERLVLYCRTTGASTAPCTFRRRCCPMHCASYGERESESRRRAFNQHHGTSNIPRIAKDESVTRVVIFCPASVGSIDDSWVDSLGSRYRGTSPIITARPPRTAIGPQTKP